jgi:hypothetical protein
LFVLDDKLVARLVLVTVSAFYGTNFGCVKILNDALSPSLAAVLRFSLAALVFLPNLLSTFPKNPNLIKGGVEVGVYSFLGYWAQATALQTTSASKGMDKQRNKFSKYWLFFLTLLSYIPNHHSQFIQLPLFVVLP